MDILKKIDEMRKKRGWSYYMLAQALSEFFAEDGDIMGADKGLSGNEKELIEMYRNLSEKDKNAVMFLINKLQ